MPFNESTWDRVIRILVGLASGYAAWVTKPATATLMTWTGICSLFCLLIGLELLITALIRHRLA